MNSKMLRSRLSMALVALIGIMVLMASAANGVEARGKENKIERYAIETLALISGANAVAEKGFFESPSVQKRLKQATKKIDRLQKMLPADSKKTEITRLLELVLIKIQDPELDQEEILDLFTQAERLANLLIDLLNPPSVSIAAELLATLITVFPAPSGEPLQELEAMIRFGLTATGDAFINPDCISIGSNADIITTAVSSNAEFGSPANDIYVVRSGATKWFEVTAALKAGDQESIKMWVSEICWGTSPDKPDTHVLRVEFETPEIFLYLTTPGLIPPPPII